MSDGFVVSINPWLMDRGAAPQSLRSWYEICCTLGTVLYAKQLFSARGVIHVFIHLKQTITNCVSIQHVGRNCADGERNTENERELPLINKHSNILCSSTFWIITQNFISLSKLGNKLYNFFWCFIFAPPSTTSLYMYFRRCDVKKSWLVTFWAASDKIWRNCTWQPKPQHII